MHHDTVPAAARPLPTFPDSVLHPRRRVRRTLARSGALLAVAAVVAAGAAVVVRRLADDGDAGVRTATAGRQTVVETLDAVATIEPVTRAEVAFPTDGTVMSVEVAVGDAVAVGDVLATIDTTELERTLHEAEVSLAEAELNLDIALSGESPTGSGGTPAVGVGLTGAATFAYVPADESLTYAWPAVDADGTAAARAEVVAAQQAVTAATNSVATARDAAVSICAAVDVTVDPNDPDASIAGISASLGACQVALSDLMTAQDALAHAQSDLVVAADALDALLGTWASELESATTSTVPSSVTTDVPPASATSVPDDTASSGTTNGSTPADGSAAAGASTPGGASGPTDSTTPGDESSGQQPSGQQSSQQSSGGGAPTGTPSGGSGSTTVTATAEVDEPTATELIAYQATYDAAARQVEAAEQALAQATIVSPIAGTVVASDVVTGDDVTATTESIVVQGEGGYEATLAVSVDDIGDLEVGQTARLVPDGRRDVVTGEVVAISAVPDSTSSAATYRVTVGLTSDDDVLSDGNIGDISVEVARTVDAIAVPTSAVTPTADGDTVTTIDAAGVEQTVKVEVGAVGPEWVEIRRGLSAGDVVVIAELGEPLPGAATEATTSAATDASTGQRGGFPPNGFTPPAG